MSGFIEFILSIIGDFLVYISKDINYLEIYKKNKLLFWVIISILIITIIYFIVKIIWGVVVHI